MSDYISREDAVDELQVKVFHNLTDEYYGTMQVLTELPAADVVPVKILKAEIYKLKCQQDSNNQDYYTGYMSALSTVEGILAEMGEEPEEAEAPAGEVLDFRRAQGMQ